MTINLYTNLSSVNVARKNLTNLIVKDIELKGDVNIKNPILILTGDAADYSKINYMRIDDFHRFYFCSVTSLPGGLVQLTGECDILSSALPYMDALPCVPSRQELKFNLYLNDGTFKSYINDIVVTKKFPSGFSGSTYVLVVAGGGDDE